MLRADLLRIRLNLMMSLDALIGRPGRSALTLLGIVIGIVALVMMMSLIDALGASVRAAIAPLGTGVFQIQKEPRFGRRGARRSIAAKRRSFTMDDFKRLQERLERTEHVGGEMWSWGNSVRTSLRQTNPVCGVAGVTSSFLVANGIELAEGRFLNAQDVDYHRDVAVIGSDVVKTLFPGGARQAMGATVRLKGRPFLVVGTMAERPALFGAAWRNCLAATPISSFQKYFGFRSLHVTFVAKERDNITPAQDEAIAVVRKMRELKPGDPADFEVFSNEGVGETLESLTIVVGAAAGGICLIALLVGGIGVMNIMLVSVMERTREIGIRKALGARPATILGQFITEAIMLAVFGGAVGVGLAFGVVEIAKTALGLPMAVPLWAVALAIVSSTAVGLVAGIYPAARAARLDPIDALRYE